MTSVKNPICQIVKIAIAICRRSLLREGFSKRHIALTLERAPSTICREIKRNRNRNGYFCINPELKRTLTIKT